MLATLAPILGLTGASQFFLVRPANITAVVGETAILTCRVGNQAQTGRTQWTKDGFALGNESHRSPDQISVDLTFVSLRFRLPAPGVPPLLCDRRPFARRI